MSVRLPVKARSLAVAAGLLGISSLPALGADWQFQPKIEGGVEYNDNYRLFGSGFRDQVYGAFTNAAFVFHYLSPVDEFSIAPAVYALYLPDSTVDDTADPSINLNWKHTGQTFTAGVFAEYVDQSVVQSDLTTAATIGNQLGNPVAGDSGFLTEKDRRQLAEVTPTLTLDLTQRQHLELTADYSNVNYNPVIPDANVGYNSLNLTAGLIQDLSQRTTLTLRGLFGQYNPRGASNTTTSYGADGQWGYHVSQVSQAYVRLGAMRSTFEQVPGAPHVASVTGVVAGAGMNWTYQVTQVFLDITRDVEPNSTGFTVDRDQLRLSINRSFSAKFTGLVGARYYRDTPTETTILFADRSYGVGFLGFKWRFRRAWTLSGEYDYTWQKYAAVSSSTANSDAVLLSVIYEPKRAD